MRSVAVRSPDSHVVHRAAPPARMFVRGMLQYEDFQRDAALYRFDVA